MAVAALRRTLLPAVLLVPSAVACGAPTPPEALVGLAVALDPPVLTMFQHSIDASHRDGWPVIRLTAGPQTPLVARQPGDNGTMVGAVDAAARLTALPGLVAVVGPAGSGEAILTAPIYHEAGIPQLLPTANAPELGRFGRWAFRLAPDLAAEGWFMADRVARVYRSRTATVFYATDDWGIALQDTVTAALRSHEVRVVDRVPVRSAPCAGDRWVDELVAASVRREVPEAAVLALRTREAACVARAVHQRSPRTRLLAGDGTSVTATFRSEVAEAAGALEVVAFWDPADSTAAARAFLRQFREATGRTPLAEEALAYDAIVAAVTAIRAVGPDPRAVRDYLAALGQRRPPLAGVTGPVAFAGTPRRGFVVHAFGDSPAKAPAR